MTNAFHLVLLLQATLIALSAQDSSQGLSTLLANRQEDSASWHRQVGLAYYLAGKIEPTLEHLQKAIRLEPQNEQYYLDLGEVLAQNNARTAVVTVFEAARNILPDSFRIQSALGVAYLTIRNYDKAKQVFAGLVLIKPDYEPGYQLLAECYDISRDWENTARIATLLRERNPRNSNGWYYGASAEYAIRKQNGESLKPAEDYVRRALDLAPADWRGHLLLGKILSESQRDQEAVSALRNAIALKSEDPKTYYLLGRVLKRLGLTKDSAEAFKEYDRARATHSANQRTLLVEIK